MSAVCVRQLCLRNSSCTPEGHVLHERMKRPKTSATASWCVYCLLSADHHKTYVGVTSDLQRRIRQHNGEISGGAKAARSGRPWTVICTVEGFAAFSQACQFEWSWKDISKKTHKSAVKGINDTEVLAIAESSVVRKRLAALERTKACKDWPSLDINWYFDRVMSDKKMKALLID
ncbi:hypothetical protein KP509_07G070500 [Ceratopteris richardii]|uniref:GIY-YIG domain-containing protein n=1 Tax=Ceratopteris richardii TaxID=49495 RepID=A0A8T2UJD0_CERRI|nr:hypothetical protein KP509_07G070500 [Ceratopteris richardii]